MVTNAIFPILTIGVMGKITLFKDYRLIKKKIHLFGNQTGFYALQSLAPTPKPPNSPCNALMLIKLFRLGYCKLLQTVSKQRETKKNTER
jgi:hypothetical protein